MNFYDVFDTKMYGNWYKINSRGTWWSHAQDPAKTEWVDMIQWMASLGSTFSESYDVALNSTRV